MQKIISQKELAVYKTSKVKTRIEDVKVVEEEPEPESSYIQLGKKIKGSNFNAGLGITVIDDQVRIESELLNKHLIIIGKPGSGKTQALKRIIYEAANYSNVNIFFVEGKGDLPLCTDIVNILYQAGKGRIPLLTMGYGDQEHETNSVYHCFKGTSLEIYNRLLALLGIDEMVGDSSYYADMYRDMLQLVCGVNKPLIDPPRCFEDLLYRTNLAWLTSTYVNDDFDNEVVRDLEERILKALQSRLRAYARELIPYVDDTGFALEDVKGAVFSMRGGAVGDSARRFLNVIIEDYKSYMGIRQKGPAILVIDEFGAFDNHNIEQLMTMGRQYETGVILGTQDVATIKDETLRQIILASAVTKVLMASDYPEEMVKLAGTKKRLEAGFEIDKEEWMTGKGTVRVQDTFVIDPNEAAKQKPGEAFIFRDRHAIQLRFDMVGEVKHDPQAIAEYKKPKKQREMSFLPQAQRKNSKHTEPVKEVPRIEFGMPKAPEVVSS